MIYRAIAAQVNDPADKGRIKVMIPSITGTAISEWIWPIINGGYVVKPMPGDQVWVMFENGDRDAPVWIGKVAEESDGQVHPSAEWALSKPRIVPEDLEERVQMIEEYLGLRSAQ